MHAAHSSTRWITALAILAAIGCGGKPQEAAANPEAKPASGTPPGAAQPAAGSASVTGSVKFAGTAPAPEKIKMDADPQCALQHTDAVMKEEVVVNANGTLKNVFVYVKQGLEGKTIPPGAAPFARLDQYGCAYSPRVLGIQTNQPLEIVNSDATLHNVNCKAVNNKPFNIAQPVKGMKSSKTFTAQEVMVKCVCNVHPWMASYIGVLPHRYFGVTGEDGSFSLAGLPAGQYTVEAWHEKYGTQTETVSVGDGESKSISFAFKGQ